MSSKVDPQQDSVEYNGQGQNASIISNSSLTLPIFFIS